MKNKQQDRQRKDRQRKARKARKLQDLASTSTPDINIGYRAGERMIFQFWDGAKWRKIDPIVVHRRLLDSPDPLDIEIKKIFLGQTFGNSDGSPLSDEQLLHIHKLAKESGASIERLAGQVRKAFGIVEYAEIDGQEQGLTEAECISLLALFFAYMDDLKKKLPPAALPTWPTPTAPPSPPTANGSATPSGSVSGSTASASSTGEPAPSPPVSESPSAVKAPETSSTP